MDRKQLRKLIREMVIETFEEFANPYHIIVLIDKTDALDLELLDEGKWVTSGIKDYWKRLDTPKFNYEQLHVHIARKKHINTKSKQVSWNLDKTKHDKKTFNANFDGMETAKRIARDALNLPSNAILEKINIETGNLLLETIEYLPESTSIFVFKVTINSNKTKIL